MKDLSTTALIGICKEILRTLDKLEPGNPMFHKIITENQLQNLSDAAQALIARR